MSKPVSIIPLDFATLVRDDRWYFQSFPDKDGEAQPKGVADHMQWPVSGAQVCPHPVDPNACDVLMLGIPVWQYLHGRLLFEVDGRYTFARASGHVLTISREFAGVDKTPKRMTVVRLYCPGRNPDAD